MGANQFFRGKTFFANAKSRRARHHNPRGTRSIYGERATFGPGFSAHPGQEIFDWRPTSGIATRRPAATLRRFQNAGGSVTLLARRR